MRLPQWIAGNSNGTCACMAVSCTITEPDTMFGLIPQTSPRARCRDAIRIKRGTARGICRILGIPRPPGITRSQRRRSLLLRSKPSPSPLAPGYDWLASSSI